MYDPSMRVLTTLEMLQARERVSGRELAERLEVSVRTVQRYIMRLQDLGVPVESTRGPGGAYRLKPGFRMPPLMLGAEEAFALALGLDALASLGLSEIAVASAAARAKLSRVMPVAIAAHVEAVRSVLDLDLPRRVVHADFDSLVTLASGVHTSQRVAIGYVDSDGAVTDRTVEPWGLIQHEGRWFLAAHCCLREAPRLFRVDRMQRVELLREPFSPPAPFDLRTFVYERMALVEAPWDVEVWLGAPIAAVEARLPRAFAILSPDGDGTVALFTTSDLEETAMTLLTVGCAVEIRRPEELRNAFRRVGERAESIAMNSRETRR